MMLSKADFEEIFPELFSPYKSVLAEIPVTTNNPACIARWEDDGGKPSHNMRRSDVSVSRTASDPYAFLDPVSTGFAFAMVPVVAAFDATQTMLLGFDRMAKL